MCNRIEKDRNLLLMIAPAWKLRGSLSLAALALIGSMLIALYERSLSMHTRRLFCLTLPWLFLSVALECSAQPTIDLSTQRNGMHSCPVGQFVMGAQVANNQLICAPQPGTFADEIVDTAHQEQGMHACPSGMGLTGLNAAKNLLACAPMAIPQGSRFVDSTTQQSGMHACPGASPVAGIQVEKNLLLCAGDILLTVDKGTLRNQMHSCPVGEFVMGALVPQNLLLCAPLAGDFAAEIVDTHTQDQGMHACPSGMGMTGLQASKNLLACAPLTAPVGSRIVDTKTQKDQMPACSGDMPVAGIQVAKGQLLCADVQPISGVTRPRYVVLTVVYAPPGTNGGKSSSSVDYGSDSSTGVKISLSSSFKYGGSVSVSAGDENKGLGGSASFSYSHDKTDDSSIDVKKSQNYDISLSGPSADGINHDEDIIYICLNPALTFQIDPANHITWSMGFVGPQMLVQYLRVAQLKNPSLIPPGVQQQLKQAGITTSDFQTMLGLDPFASGGTEIDPMRFLPTTQSFPYIPPLTQSDPAAQQKYQQSNMVMAGTGTKVQLTYTVSASGGVNLVIAQFKASGQLEWTYTSETSNTTESTQSATVTVGGPAFGYTGPTDVLVYWDTVFNSFMFAFAQGEPSASGLLTDKSGKPVANAPVALAAGTRTFQTFTDKKGEFRFYNTPAGSGMLAALGERLPLKMGPGTSKQTLSLTMH
jgi:hypothetical protein